MIYALYNPYVANHTGENSAKNLIKIFKEEKIEIINLLTLDYQEFFSNLNQDDSVILCGGDGTLNRFVNDVSNIEIKHNIYYYAIGSGNDFLRDLEKSDNSPFLINEFLNKLPTVNIEDKDYSFLNGIGLGIDGFICYEGNRLREQSNNKINYTLLAVKALLFQYKPCNATVTVDGKEYNFKNVWLATTMKGRFFGGGMKIAPNQDRFDKDNKLSVIIVHNLNKLSIIKLFPTIFEGKHIKYKKYVSVFEANSVSVRFDEPSAIQIDGEASLNIKEYSATNKIKIKKI